MKAPKKLDDVKKDTLTDLALHTIGYKFSYKVFGLFLLAIMSSILIVAVPAFRVFEIKLALKSVDFFAQPKFPTSYLAPLFGRIGLEFSHVEPFIPWLLAGFVVWYSYICAKDFIQSNASKIRWQTKNVWDNNLWEGEGWISGERRTSRSFSDWLVEGCTKRRDTLSDLIWGCKDRVGSKLIELESDKPEHRAITLLSNFSGNLSFWFCTREEGFPATTELSDSIDSDDLKIWLKRFSHWIILDGVLSVVGIRKEIVDEIKPQPEIIGKVEVCVTEVFERCTEAMKIRGNLEGVDEDSENQMRWLEEDTKRCLQCLATIEKGVTYLDDLRIQFYRLAVTKNSNGRESVLNDIESIIEALDEVMGLNNHHNNKIESLMPIGATV